MAQPSYTLRPDTPEVLDLREVVSPEGCKLKGYEVLVYNPSGTLKLRSTYGAGQIWEPSTMDGLLPRLAEAGTRFSVHPILIDFSAKKEPEDKSKTKKGKSK